MQSEIKFSHKKKTVFSLKKKKRKSPAFSTSISFLFSNQNWKRTSFCSSDPSGRLQAEQGNFPGFIINIQPLSHASLGHFGGECAQSHSGFAQNFINTAVNDKTAD